MRAAPLLVLLLLLSAACGPTAPVCPASCAGCCDVDGQCLGGTANAACGAGAMACQACGVGSQCVGGACQAASYDTAEQFCLAWVDALIGFRLRCGVWSAAGAERIRGAWTGQCARGEVWPGLKDGRLRYEAAGAAACIAGLARQSCSTTLDAAFDRCDPVLAGAVPVGGSCFDDDECESQDCDTQRTCPGRCLARVAVGVTLASGQRCVDGAEPYQGVCTALVPEGGSCAATGGSSQRHGCVAGAECDASERCVATTYLGGDQACTDTGTPCGWGLFCSTSRCELLRGPGDSCGTSSLCQWDLLCDATSHCAALGALGATCKENTQCGEGLFCNRPSGAGSTGACATLHGSGQSCSETGGECAAAFFCTASSFDPSGTCEARLAANAVCYEVTPNPCAAGLYCDVGTGSSGRCVSQLADGAGCSGDVACTSGRCTASGGSGFCLPPDVCVDPTP